MHATGITDTLCAALVLFGLMLQAGSTMLVAKLFLIAGPAAADLADRHPRTGQGRHARQAQAAARRREGTTIDILIDIVLLGFLSVTVLAVIFLRDLFAIVMLFGIYSFLAAALFVTLDAVDVAFTEAAVGAGVATFLMLATLALTDRREKPIPDRPLLPLLVIGIVGAALVYGTSDMPHFERPGRTGTSTM